MSDGAFSDVVRVVARFRHFDQYPATHPKVRAYYTTIVRSNPYAIVFLVSCVCKINDASDAKDRPSYVGNLFGYIMPKSNKRN